MDKLRTDGTKKSPKEGFDKIRRKIRQTIKGEGCEPSALACDLMIFTVGFLMARCHLLFGVRPLGIALVSAMPIGVWQGLLGSVIGGLSLGVEGIVFAVASALSVFLRVAIGYSESDGLFKEPLPIRLSVSVLSSFVGGVFEVIRYGLNESSLLFGLFMIILTPLSAYVFSRLFVIRISIDDLLFGEEDPFSMRDRTKEEKQALILFQISSLMLIFFIGLSFKGVDLFGVSLSYLFSGAVTLLCAKRFGGIRGMAVGFASSLGLSGILSVSFALAGLCSGALFSLGTGYALLGGGLAIAVFSSYSLGLGGLLATLPEYIISVALIFPLLKKAGRKDTAEERDTGISVAEDMVGTMALAYQGGYRGRASSIDRTLFSLSSVVKSYASTQDVLSYEEYRAIIIGLCETYCSGCEERGLCTKEGISPCIKNSEKLALMLSEGKRIAAEDINTDTELCRNAGLIADRINRECARAERERCRANEGGQGAEEYELISRLISEALTSDEAEKKVDASLTPRLTEIIEKRGLYGKARAFGKRKRHFIIACEDADGSRIISPELREDIESAFELRLGEPSFFRRDRMAVMECEATAKISVSSAMAMSSGSESEISGDSLCFFEGREGYYYSLLSDGMGSGEIAKETSSFVCDFLSNALKNGADKEALIHMLNNRLRARREECSATVDLLEIDLIGGEGIFIKSGAAPSFVKRGSSIFRIRSQTAPIGLMESIDSEKIKVDLRIGDHLIMLSDGIADESDDAPWLLLLLGEEALSSPEAYARKILCEAIKNVGTRDDMTVAVIKIEKA